MAERRQRSKSAMVTCLWAALVAALVLLPFLLMFMSCKRSVEKWQHEYDDLTLVEVSSHTGIAFPASANLIHSYGNRGNDAEIYVLIEMDRGDVDGFVKGLPQGEQDRSKPIVSRTDREDVEMTSGSRSPGWWKPQEANEFIYVTWQGGYVRHASLARMLINLDDPRKAIVYLYYYV